MKHFILDQRLWLIALMRIVTVNSGPLNRRWSAQMKPRDHVNLSRRVTSIVRSSLDVCDVSTCPRKFIGCVKSFDKRLRFKRFEIPIVVQLESTVYPLHLSDDRQFKFNTRLDAPRAATSSIVIDRRSRLIGRSRLRHVTTVLIINKKIDFKLEKYILNSSKSLEIH